MLLAFTDAAPERGVTDLALELGMVAPVFAVTPIQVAIAFRDSRGQQLDRTRLDVALPFLYAALAGGAAAADLSSGTAV